MFTRDRTRSHHRFQSDRFFFDLAGLAHHHPVPLDVDYFHILSTFDHDTFGDGVNAAVREFRWYHSEGLSALDSTGAA
ncbi:MAG: hypothetical protein U1D30_03820 [Planctomycetota bacterium]